MEHRSLETYELACGYPFPMHIQCVSHSIFNSGCNAYQTSYSTSPGSNTGYVYTMAGEHSPLVYRMAVENYLLVYRMAVEHSLLRRRRSGTS